MKKLFSIESFILVTVVVFIAIMITLVFAPYVAVIILAGYAFAVFAGLFILIAKS